MFHPSDALIERVSEQPVTTRSSSLIVVSVELPQDYGALDSPRVSTAMTPFEGYDGVMSAVKFEYSATRTSTPIGEQIDEVENVLLEDVTVR